MNLCTPRTVPNSRMSQSTRNKGTAPTVLRAEVAVLQGRTTRKRLGARAWDCRTRGVRAGRITAAATHAAFRVAPHPTAAAPPIMPCAGRHWRQKWHATMREDKDENPCGH